MGQIWRIFVKVRESQRGQTMAEYALILAAIAVVCIVGYNAMGTAVNNLVTGVNAQL